MQFLNISSLDMAMQITMIGKIMRIMVWLDRQNVLFDSTVFVLLEIYNFNLKFEIMEIFDWKPLWTK